MFFAFLPFLKPVFIAHFCFALVEKAKEFWVKKFNYFLNTIFIFEILRCWIPALDQRRSWIDVGEFSFILYFYSFLQFLDQIQSKRPKNLHSVCGSARQIFWEILQHQQHSRMQAQRLKLRFDWEWKVEAWKWRCLPFQFERFQECWMFEEQWLWLQSRPTLCGCFFEPFDWLETRRLCSRWSSSRGCKALQSRKYCFQLRWHGEFFVEQNNNSSFVFSMRSIKRLKAWWSTFHLRVLTDDSIPTLSWRITINLLWVLSVFSHCNFALFRPWLSSRSCHQIVLWWFNATLMPRTLNVTPRVVWELWTLSLCTSLKIQKRLNFWIWHSGIFLWSSAVVVSNCYQFLRFFFLLLIKVYYLTKFIKCLPAFLFFM